MIAPWQVWAVDSLGADLAVVISSDFHLGLSGGRTATIIPLAPTSVGLDYRVGIMDTSTGDKRWAVTDQIRTINTLYLSGDKPVCTLPDETIRQLKAVLRHMVAF